MSIKCQHDLFAPECSVRLERHWQTAPRASCAVCGSSVEFSKRGLPVVPITVEVAAHIGQFADGRFGCIHCGAYRTPKGKIVHSDDCVVVAHRSRYAEIAGIPLTQNPKDQP